MVAGQGGCPALSGAEDDGRAGGTVEGGKGGAGQTLQAVAGAPGGAEHSNSCRVHSQDLPGRNPLPSQEVAALLWRGNHPQFTGEGGVERVGVRQPAGNISHLTQDRNREENW